MLAEAVQHAELNSDSAFIVSQRLAPVKRRSGNESAHAQHYCQGSKTQQDTLFHDTYGTVPKKKGDSAKAEWANWRVVYERATGGMAMASDSDSDSAATAHSSHGRRARHGVRIGGPGDHGHGHHVAGTPVAARGKKGRRIFYCFSACFSTRDGAPWMHSCTWRTVPDQRHTWSRRRSSRLPAPLFGPASPSINSSRSTGRADGMQARPGQARRGRK